MLNNKGFDMWADGYDLSVKLSEDKNKYPFAGYKDVLNHIYNEIRGKNDAKILDIGFGTGILTKKLYDDGYKIQGIDFSKEMLKIARKKMPLANFTEWDFSKGLPYSFKDEKFDFVVCTYAIHHLTDIQKIAFLNELKKYLEPGGVILIGDIAFIKENDLDACRNENLNIWDNDEIYIAYESIVEQLEFEIKSFKQISFCAGIVIMSDTIY